MPLIREQLKLINFCETYWWNEGHFPSDQALLEHFSKIDPYEAPLSPLLSPLEKHTLIEWYNDATFNLALENRGIQLGKVTALSQKQMAAIGLFLASSSHRQFLSRLKQLKVTEQQWNSWKRQTRFMNHLTHRVNLNTEHFVPEARTAVVNGVKRGDFNFTKLYLEMQGLYDSSGKNNDLANASLVVTRLLEAVQSVVTPEQLKLISAEFDAIMGGGSRNVVQLKPVAQREVTQLEPARVGFKHVDPPPSQRRPSKQTPNREDNQTPSKPDNLPPRTPPVTPPPTGF